MDDNFGLGWFLGVATVALAIFALWHIAESSCQEVNNVYDCEITRPLFTPVIQGETA